MNEPNSRAKFLHIDDLVGVHLLSPLKLRGETEYACS